MANFYSTKLHLIHTNDINLPKLLRASEQTSPRRSGWQIVCSVHFLRLLGFFSIIDNFLSIK